MKTIAQSVGKFTLPALEIPGYRVRPFENQGRELEAAIRAGEIAGVLDLSLGELADELFGGLNGAGPDRLTAAALAGIPQVIAPGGLDTVNTPIGPRRTTPEECDRLGLEIAQKACAARGPTIILIPLRGFSILDRKGGSHWNPEANGALIQSMRNWIYGVEIREFDLHISDPEFSAAAVACLIEFTQ